VTIFGTSNRAFFHPNAPQPCDLQGEKQVTQIASPLDSFRHMFQDRDMPGPKALISSEQEQQILAAVAGGQPIRVLAEHWGVSPSTIWRVTRRHDNPLFIKALRAEIRSRNLKRLARVGTKVLDKLDNRLSQPLGKTGAMEVDALARAAFNLEKTSASLSGELAKVVGTGIAIQVMLPDWAGGTGNAPPAHVDAGPPALPEHMPAHAQAELANFMPDFQNSPPTTPKNLAESQPGVGSDSGS
jgi:hypothetical protein